MKLYNTLTRKKEEFIPLKPNEVTMYSCGPTVYNFFHVGNARPFIIFDALRSYFIYRGNKVTFVQNFTDIDDKMINKANELGVSVKELADEFINEYFTDAEGLNIKKADVHPKATENIDAIIDIISKLIDNGNAYVSNGDVYFNTKSFNEYGKLSHQPLDELELGARIDVNEQKDSPMDFALWKAQKPGEPAWESPWGPGRPGWHIECSAMANKYLGNTIDIHSGGQDLIFPHHENEVAQSECANHAPFARYWIHNGYINVNNQKMSKSLGNFFTVRDIAKDFDYEVIRFFMLSAHYRSPINFSKELMEQAKSGLERIYNCLENCEFYQKTAQQGETDRDLVKKLTTHKENYILALDDDFNTALAISSIFDIVRDVNQISKEANFQTLEYSINTMKELGSALGLLQRTNNDSLDAEVDQLITKRQEARKEKNFVLADQIRDKLQGMGIILEDTPSGVKWKRG